jgi:hypothetical protein
LKERRGKPSYDVAFEELRLEEIAERLNRFERADEKPVRRGQGDLRVQQRAYELFGRPAVKAVANEYGAKLSRLFIPCARSDGPFPISILRCRGSSRSPTQ